jgi:hypothetical protein
MSHSAALTRAENSQASDNQIENVSKIRPARHETCLMIAFGVLSELSHFAELGVVCRLPHRHVNYFGSPNHSWIS